MLLCGRQMYLKKYCPLKKTCKFDFVTVRTLLLFIENQHQEAKGDSGE